MVSLNRVRFAWIAPLVAGLAGAAAAQTVDFDERLREGQQLYTQGRYTDAEQLLGAALREAEREQLGSGLVARILDLRGQTEEALGNYVEAENVLNRALAICRQSAAPGNTSASAVATHLAELYLVERRPADAEPLLRRSIAAIESKGAGNGVPLAVNEADLAVALGQQRKFGEAEHLLREALKLLEAELGPNHPTLVGVLLPLTGVLIAAHRCAEAVEPAERAWQITRAAAPRIGDPDIAATLDTMGLVYWKAGRPQEAEVYSEQAVAVAEGVYGPDQRQLGWYLKNYAGILRQLGRKSEAKALDERAKAILAENARRSSGSRTVDVNALR